MHRVRWLLAVAHAAIGCGGDAAPMSTPECDASHIQGACPATAGRPPGLVCFGGTCLPPNPQYCGTGFGPCGSGRVCATGFDTLHHQQGFCCPVDMLQPPGATLAWSTCAHP